MKNIFATAALLTLSATAFLGATTDAAKTDCTKCPSNGVNKAVAATPTTPSNSTMTAEQQAFCNKLNSKAQQLFKAMDNATRMKAMETAKTKEPNQAVEEVAKMLPKA